MALLPEPADPQPLLHDFRADPVAQVLKTPSGKIEIFSEKIAGFGYDDCPGHPAWLEPIEWLGAASAKDYPLHLISNQPSTKLHSQYDMGSHSQAAKINHREPVRLHPADAARRNIKAGDIVRLFNARGECLASAVLSDAVRPGVVQISTGAWYDPEKPGKRSLDKHGNPNVLTPDRGTSKLAQADHRAFLPDRGRALRRCAAAGDLFTTRRRSCGATPRQGFGTGITRWHSGAAF
ncbi:MAG: molybdopterin dinucleotide binding domain-containing protein [Pseudolabrys sp.]